MSALDAFHVEFFRFNAQFFGFSRNSVLSPSLHNPAIHSDRPDGYDRSMLRKRLPCGSRVGQITAAIVFTFAAPVIAQGLPANQNVRTAQLTADHSQEPNQPPTRDKEGQNTSIDWPRVGIGFSTAVGNLFYIPAKIAYGTLGSVVGGAAYVFSRQDHHAARQIWRNSLGGDYVLTPEMLTGHEPIHFMGTAPKSQPREALPHVSQPGKTPPESFAAATGADRSSRAEPAAGPTNLGHGSSSTLEIPDQNRLHHPDLNEQEIPPSEAPGRSERLPQMSIERQ